MKSGFGLTLYPMGRLRHIGVWERQIGREHAHTRLPLTQPRADRLGHRGSVFTVFFDRTPPIQKDNAKWHNPFLR